MSNYIQFSQYKKRNCFLDSNKTKESCKLTIITKEPYEKNTSKTPVQQTTVLKEYPANGNNLGDPNIWGSTYWFTFHTGSTSYPTNPSKIVQQRMKGFIKGIPYIIPCEKCSVHALNYIEKSDLDTVCKNRKSLFKFFVDLHNDVNKRLGRPTMTLQDAKDKYINGQFRFVKYK